MKAWLLGLLGLVLGVAGVIAVAGWRWRARTREAVARLRVPASPAARFSASELEGLPAPVRRYFLAVLREGQPVFRRARFSQEGDFLVNPKKNGWGPFTATEDFSSQPPGFVWDARIRMAPGVSVQVRDSFVEGTGSMHGSVLGLFPVVSVEGTPEIAAGALHRYLAEAVWFPTALLPSQGVVWTPIDERSARASLTAGGTTVGLDFRFGADGLVESVFTPERARDVDGHAVPTPWQGHFFDYEERGGMRIPLGGEVGWLLPEGPQVYWRGRITGAAFDGRD